MLWLDEDFTAPPKPLTWEEKAQQLEDELAQARRELTDVRKDLAAKVGGARPARLAAAAAAAARGCLPRAFCSSPQPDPTRPQTVQLSRRDEAATQEKAAELAASAFEEKNRQLQELSAMLNRLELQLQQKVGRRAAAQLSRRGPGSSGTPCRPGTRRLHAQPACWATCMAGMPPTLARAGPVPAH